MIPIIQCFTDPNGDVVYWCYGDHNMVDNWCLTNPEEISTEENYNFLNNTNVWDMTKSIKFYKLIIDYYLKNKNDFMFI